jgi:hypothetical protein
VVLINQQPLPPIRKVSISSCGSHGPFSAAKGCLLEGLPAIQELQLLVCNLSDGFPNTLVQMHGLTVLKCPRCRLRHLPGGAYLAGEGHVGGRLVSKAGYVQS